MALTHSRLHGRRRFLFAASAAAIGTLPMARIASACSPRTLRLGVLLPHSTRYPGIAREFLAGFEAHAASDAARVRLEVIPIECADELCLRSRRRGGASNTRPRRRRGGGLRGR